MVAMAGLPAAYALATEEEGLELRLSRQDMVDLQKRADEAEAAAPPGPPCAAKVAVVTGKGPVQLLAGVAQESLPRAYARIAAEDSLEVSLAKQDMHSLQRRADADAVDLASAYEQAAADDALEIFLAAKDMRELQARADEVEAAGGPRPCSRPAAAGKAPVDIDLVQAYMRLAAEDELEAALSRKDMRQLQHRADAAEGRGAAPPCAPPSVPIAQLEDLAEAYARIAEEDAMETSLAARDLHELQRRTDATEARGPGRLAAIAAAATAAAAGRRAAQPAAAAGGRIADADLAAAYARLAAEDRLEASLAKQDMRGLQRRADAEFDQEDIAQAYARMAAEDALEASLARADMRSIQTRADAKEGLEALGGDQAEAQPEDGDDASDEINFDGTSPLKKRRVDDKWDRQVSDASTAAPDGWQRQVSESSTLAPSSPVAIV